MSVLFVSGEGLVCVNLVSRNDRQTIRNSPITANATVMNAETSCFDQRLVWRGGRIFGEVLLNCSFVFFCHGFGVSIVLDS